MALAGHIFEVYFRPLRLVSLLTRRSVGLWDERRTGKGFGRERLWSNRDAAPVLASEEGGCQGDQTIPVKITGTDNKCIHNFSRKN